MGQKNVLQNFTSKLPFQIFKNIFPIISSSLKLNPSRVSKEFFSSGMKKIIVLTNQEGLGGGGGVLVFKTK